MTPKLATAVDPIFLHVLELLESINQGKSPPTSEERLRIKALIDQAEAIVGASEEWELAKYALVSWIDEVVVDSKWEGASWWTNNLLEMEFFNTRSCFEQFYVNAQKASTLPGRDALEVYYVCVVLGFLGLYRDPQVAEGLIQSHRLPEDISAWARQASMAIRLGQGRPALPPPRREIAGAPPSRGKTLVVWAWLAALILAASNVVFFVLFRPGG